MNERMKTQLEALCREPERFNGTPEDAQRMTDRMKVMLKEDRIDTDDLMEIARGYDINLKALLMMTYLPSSDGIVKEETIIDCIERDDLNSLLFISYNAIIFHNGKYHPIYNIIASDAREISKDTIIRLQEYLVKHGCPTHARNIASIYAFWKVPRLNEAECDESKLMKYIFGVGGIKIPNTDPLSIDFFNQLVDEDKEYVLDKLIAAYKKFSFKKIDDSTLFVAYEEIDSNIIVQRADFDALETDSPKKAELIALQNKLFG